MNTLEVLLEMKRRWSPWRTLFLNKAKANNVRHELAARTGLCHTVNALVWDSDNGMTGDQLYYLSKEVKTLLYDNAVNRGYTTGGYWWPLSNRRDRRRTIKAAIKAYKKANK